MTTEEMDKLNIEALVNRLHKLETNGVPGVRDFFATSALSVLANDYFEPVIDPHDVAVYAYEVADAMMKVRLQYAQ